MKKIKLHAIGNDEDFNYYIFDKNEGVIDDLDKTFRKLFNSHIQFYLEHENKKGKSIRRKRKFEKLKDYHEIVSSQENKRIDIFYGDKKIFVAIHCPQKLRLKFNEELEKISTMPKPKKEKK